MKTGNPATRKCLLSMVILLSSVGNVQFAAASPPSERPDGLLIDAGTLNARIDRPTLRILDTRSADQYRAGHVPGALHVDVARWRSKALSPGGLRDADYWAEEIGRLGIEANSQVVVYGGPLPDAARTWWTLRYLGLPGVALLDGGWPAWVEKKLPVEGAVPHVQSTQFKPDFQADRLVQISELRRAVEARDSKHQVVDARTKGEFTGKTVRGKRGGHIPDAVHIEWKDLVDESGKFKSHDELVAMFSNRGVVRGRTIVTYCQSGGRSSVEAFALELAGYQNVKNYYCSWQEWSAAEAAPVEK